MAFGQQEKLRQLVAASTTFQSEVGAANKTEALNHVHRFQALEEWHPAPRAVVRFTTHQTYDEGIGNWRSESTLTLEIELKRDIAQVDTATLLSDMESDVIEAFGDIEDELKTLQGTDNPDDTVTYIRITRLDMLQYDCEGAGERDVEEIQDPEKHGNQALVWWMRWEVATK